MYELAGELAIADPWPYTLRQLDWMGNARRNAAWDHTSEILAMLYNTHRSAKTSARSPKNFHPKYRKRTNSQPAQPMSAKQHVAILKSILLRKQ